MNARARILIQSELSLDNFIRWLCTWQTVTLISLLVALFLTSIAVVYVKDQYRHLTHELQSLQAQQTRLEVAREQLWLEEGTWSAQSRIRNIAKHRLDMHTPTSVVPLYTK